MYFTNFIFFFFHFQEDACNLIEYCFNLMRDINYKTVKQFLDVNVLYNSLKNSNYFDVIAVISKEFFLLTDLN